SVPAKPCPALIMAASGFCCASQHSQEIGQIDFFLLGITDIEAAIVKIDEFMQVRCRAVHEIRRACGKTTELLDDDGADVFALAGDQSPSRVLRINGTSEKRMRRQVGATSEFEQGHYRRFCCPGTFRRFQGPGMV